MTDDHGSDPLLPMFTQAFWDERYADSDRLWSGAPNPRLVEQVSGLAPGTALDVGCGEGADVVWLAREGWRVTGVDVSEVALERARGHADDAGVGGVTGQVAFEHVDVIAGEPLPGPVDLVSAQYFHAPTSAFDDAVQALGAAVAPGGLLLVVGHHPDDAATGLRNPELSSLLFTPDRVVAALTAPDPDAWEVRVADAPTRVVRRDDRDVTITDTVVLALKR